VCLREGRKIVTLSNDLLHIQALGQLFAAIAAGHIQKVVNDEVVI
jgi:hypothetical protein